tara:strand:- start:391 stop:939 length:549 start_codon:yes stop_codon:yes gene_type:complete
MFKRDILLSIGGFNPSWYHAEDMEVSLKLVQDGGTIVYTPDAVVNHIPETGIRRFLQKRKRDARAHVRIHRRYKGVKHDFIGSSWIVLWMIPLIALGSFGISIYVGKLLDYDKLDASAFYLSLTREVLLICLLPLFWLSAYLSSHLPKRGIKAIFILATWSLALWQGILLGYVDALLRRNGH